MVRYLAAGLLLALAACSDPAGPCDRAFACETEGVDLTVVRASMLNPLGVHPLTGLPEAPRELEIGYVVRNRGTVASSPAIVHLSGWFDSDDAATATNDTLVSLAPGDSAVGVLKVHFAGSFLHDSPERNADVVIVRANGLSDAEPANDRFHLPAFQLTIPSFALTVRGPGVPRIGVNEEFPFGFTLRNLSRYEPLPALTFAVCLWEYDVTCTPGTGWAIAARHGSPALPKDGAWSLDSTLIIPPTGAWQDHAGNYGLALCLIESDWPDRYMKNGPTQCDFAGNVRVRPDYENACHPPVLQPGVPNTLTDFNCGLTPPTRQNTLGIIGEETYWTSMLMDRFYLFAMDLTAGQRYALSGYGLTVRDAQGEEVTGVNALSSFTVPGSGRYYVVANSRQSPMQVTLDRL